MGVKPEEVFTKWLELLRDPSSRQCFKAYRTQDGCYCALGLLMLSFENLGVVTEWLDEKPLSVYVDWSKTKKVSIWKAIEYIFPREKSDNVFRVILEMNDKLRDSLPDIAFKIELIKEKGIA